MREGCTSVMPNMSTTVVQRVRTTVTVAYIYNMQGGEQQLIGLKQQENEEV